MKHPILYLAGPMSGLPEFNHPAFHAAAAELRAAGYTVINPAENGLDRDAPWLRHMRHDIAQLVTLCDAVATLPGSPESRGAMIEVGLARGLGFPVMSVTYWLQATRTEAAA